MEGMCCLATNMRGSLSARFSPRSVPGDFVGLRRPLWPGCVPRDTQHSAVAPLPKRHPTGRSAPAARPAGAGERWGEAATVQGQGRPPAQRGCSAQTASAAAKPAFPDFWAACWDGCSGGGAPNPSSSPDTPSPSCRGSGSQELGNGNCSRPGREPLGRQSRRSVHGVGATSDSPVPASQSPHTAGPE